MNRSILFIAVFAAVSASAQDLGVYNRALSAFNAGNYDDSAQLFYEVNNSSTDPDLQNKSQYYLAASFQKRGMPVSAFVYFDQILRAGKAHPFHLKAVEGLVNIQDQLDDMYMIPSELNKYYDADAWATLPSEVLARVNYLIATLDYRSAKLDEGRDFALAVPQDTTVYLKAQYLLGTIYADPRYPGEATRFDDAIKAFTTVIDSKLPNQKDDKLTKQLALLGLGRVHYGLGRYDKSVEAYDQIPRFSKYWDQALFENGFARFQNDDLGGGLGSLQALHAPQFAGAFQPESWILKATIYYFSCLYEESKSALAAFDEIYLPMSEKLKPLVEGTEQRDPIEYFKLIDARDTDKVPLAVLNNVRSNERMLGVFSLLKQIEVEKKQLEENSAWRAARLSNDVITQLDGIRGGYEVVAGRLARIGLVNAYKSIKGFADTAEIIRFETSKAEKELAEAGVDQKAALRKQALYRPQMPAENWNYWKFQGEFWRDEIGYYQYTLKKCPGQATE